MKYNSRKLLLVLFVYISSIVLLWYDKIDSGGFVTITIGVVGAYIAGNVLQKRGENEDS